jgi:hypothetical protein
MQSQHTDEWAKYQTLSFADKLAYFNKKEAMGIDAFLDKDRDNLTFVISQPAIVDDIVGNLFFNPKEDEEDDDSKSITKANARNCSSCKKTDRTWSSSITRCVSISQLNTCLLDYRFPKLQLSSPNIGTCARTQSLWASMITLWDNLSECSSPSPCS